MIKFEKYFAESIFDFHSRNSLVSEDLFKNVIRGDRCFAILVSTDKKDIVSCIESANHRKFYSLISKSKNGLMGGILLVQKNNEREEDFKESVNSIYPKNSTIGVIYRGTDCLKVIKESNIEVYGIEKENYDFFNISVSRIFNTDCKISGIEMPIDESIIKKYRNLGFIVPSQLLAEDCKNMKNIA